MELLHQLIKKRLGSQRGQLLVEALVAMALSAVLLPALITGLVASTKGKPQQIQRAAAVALLKESEEAVRSVRENGWNSFAVNGTFHPAVSGSTWTLASGATTINGFNQSLTISDVHRDSNGVVVESGGTLDPSTKKVDLQITWSQPYSSNVTSSMFITRFQKNAASTSTSTTDFNAGTLTDTAVTNTSGGEITLSPNTKGKWCSPAFSSATIDLPDGPPVAVAATASANVTVPNDVFVATAPFASTSGKLAYVNVSANTDPPAATLKGIFTLDPARYSAPGLVPSGIGLDNDFKTNDIKYYKSSSGKLYALIATTKPDKEVIAILVKNADGTDAYQDPTNKIYQFWTFFNTIIYGNATGSSDTGFSNPSANSSDSGGDGNGFQSNPTNAYSDNSSFALDSNSGSGTSTNCTGSDKDKHRYYDYNLNVPSDASIGGIEVKLIAKADSTSGSPKMCVQLSWDGGNTWTTAKQTSTLTTNSSGSTYTLGTTSDNWGHTWTPGQFSNTNFRVRVINTASSTSRDFSLDYSGVRITYSAPANDQSPYDYGATALNVLGNRGYVASGGYLYVFDLSNIDSKTTSNGLDQIGCRIELDGFDCKVSTSKIRKYGAGDTNTNWEAESNGQAACLDGGNTEINADNDIFPVSVGPNTYVYVAVGASTNPEFNIVNATDIPTGSTSPNVSNASCGRASGGASGWKRISSLDFNSNGSTEEAANSVFAKSDGTRAYISSNGGVDENHDGTPDSWQFYVLDTSDKTNPSFLSGTSTATSGYYYGTGANVELHPRRSLTVLNGLRAILVGKDGTSNGNNAQEYQVLNIENENTPLYCSGIDYNQGFNDLTYVIEGDRDTFVYMVANTPLNELKIIQGGPDGTYLDSGTYESVVKDLESMVGLNRLSTTATISAGTTLQFQLAATSPVAGSCAGATYTYVGPDGTTGTYFPSSGGTIPLTGVSGFANPAQCVKYKAYLTTTDYNTTPSLLDASINFSP